ncbi:MAG: TIGR01777 family oxidoreductase [Desulfobacula sp.]|nr:TIGR01777 family oxidoreductase [Desulfobacula sp.]
MRKMVITGASGFVGKALSKKFLTDGYHVIGIGTSLEHPLCENFNNFTWISADTTIPGDWQNHISRADIIINLAGRNIFRYWTKKYKQAIFDSRIVTTRNIVDAMVQDAGQHLLNASAVGIYGDCGDNILTEENGPGESFLAYVCKAWEKEATRAGEKGARVSILRFGVVLGDGGALSKMLPAFKLFVGGPLGSGQHWFPWIHQSDLEAAIAFIIGNDDLEGLFNFTGCRPIRQGHFAKILAKVLNRPIFMPVPAFIIKLVMGELGSVLLQSQKALPKKLLDSGYLFEFADVTSSLEDILKK